ncbi:MAG: hypothetical protein SPI77_07695 [Corynebacterium sp.]|nr:hypothetical protein [Corynebacterium sp.]
MRMFRRPVAATLAAITLSFGVAISATPSAPVATAATPQEQIVTFLMQSPLGNQILNFLENSRNGSSSLLPSRADIMRWRVAEHFNAHRVVSGTNGLGWNQIYANNAQDRADYVASVREYEPLYVETGFKAPGSGPYVWAIIYQGDPSQALDVMNQLWNDNPGLASHHAFSPAATSGVGITYSDGWTWVVINWG